MAEIGPFQWGAGGEALSPEQVKRRRDVADAMRMKQGFVPGNGMDLLGGLAREAVANFRGSQADASEQEGVDGRKAVIAALTSNPNAGMTDIVGALGNEWVAADPGSQAVVQALMGQKQQQDNWAHDAALKADERAYDAPLREIQLQQGQNELNMAPFDQRYKEAQIDALNAKPAITPTDDQREYEMAKTQGFPGTFLEFKAAQRANSGLSIRTNPDGTTEILQGDLSGMPKTTEGQSKDIGFLTRGAGANDLLSNLDTELTSVGGAVAGAVPGGNFVQSEKYQQANQAGLEFLAALLRKDSGGAITPDENKGYGDIYLPRPGDQPAVIAQKREARQRALSAIELGLPPAVIKAMEVQGVDLSGARVVASGEAPPTAAPIVPLETGQPTEPRYSQEAPPEDWSGPGNWEFMTPEQRALWK